MNIINHSAETALSTLIEEISAGVYDLSINNYNNTFIDLGDGVFVMMINTFLLDHSLKTLRQIISDGELDNDGISMSYQVFTKNDEDGKIYCVSLIEVWSQYMNEKGILKEILDNESLENKDVNEGYISIREAKEAIKDE